MKKFYVALLSLILLCTTGCSNNNGSNTTNRELDCTTLKVYNTGEYIDQDRIKAFENLYGVRVVYDLFASNEEMYTKLLGGDNYDVIVPSDYSIERMIAEDRLLEIDWDLLENADGIIPALLNQSYDEGSVYSVPYFWGTVGIIYDTTVVSKADVEREGWDVLMNTKYKDDLYLYDSERDTFMVALKALGYSMNTDDEAEIQAAYEWLLNVNDTMNPVYVTDEVIDNVIAGLKAMAVVYSGDAVYMMSENEDLAYYAPQQGTNTWTDALVIPKTTQCPLTAHAWIDYMLDEEVAYDNTIYVGYASPIQSVFDEVSTDEEDGYGLFDAYVPRSGYAKDEVFHYNETQRKRLAELFTLVKAQ